MKVKLRTSGVIPRIVVVSALLVLAAIGVVTTRSLAAPVSAPAPGVCSETCARTAMRSADALVQSRDLRHHEVER